MGPIDDNFFMGEGGMKSSVPKTRFSGISIESTISLDTPKSQILNLPL